MELTGVHGGSKGLAQGEPSPPGIHSRGASVPRSGLPKPLKSEGGVPKTDRTHKLRANPCQPDKREHGKDGEQPGPGQNPKSGAETWFAAPFEVPPVTSC